VRALLGGISQIMMMMMMMMTNDDDNELIYKAFFAVPLSGAAAFVFVLIPPP